MKIIWCSILVFLAIYATSCGEKNSSLEGNWKGIGILNENDLHIINPNTMIINERDTTGFFIHDDSIMTFYRHNDTMGSLIIHRVDIDTFILIRYSLFESTDTFVRQN